METINSATSIRVPWNKGKLVGQKAPFKLKEIWANRVRELGPIMRAVQRALQLFFTQLVDWIT
jgi:hypothetical protein